MLWLFSQHFLFLGVKHSFVHSRFDFRFPKCYIPSQHSPPFHTSFGNFRSTLYIIPSVSKAGLVTYLMGSQESGQHRMASVPSRQYSLYFDSTVYKKATRRCRHYSNSFMTPTPTPTQSYTDANQNLSRYFHSPDITIPVDRQQVCLLASSTNLRKKRNQKSRANWTQPVVLYSNLISEQRVPTQISNNQAMTAV